MLSTGWQKSDAKVKVSLIAHQMNDKRTERINVVKWKLHMCFMTHHVLTEN